MSLHSVWLGLWVAFGAIWAAAAMKTRPVARRASGWQRFVQLGLMAPGTTLLFSRFLSVGALGARFVPASFPATAAIEAFGVAMTAAGIAFAVWARFALGQNWSREPAVKEGHELICRGPYAWVRHPIYAGVLLALLGSALYIGEVRGLIAFGLFAAGWWLKARTEEGLMLEQFGEQYRRYRSEVKALIPFVL